MARTKKTGTRRTRGTIRVKRNAAYTATARTGDDRRDNEVAAQIDAAVTDGAALRREIEERIEERMHERPRKNTY